jgi:hypothetical protein
VPDAVSKLPDLFDPENHPSVKGLLGALWLESLDEPGLLVWLSGWDTPACMQAFLTGTDYACGISTLKPYRIAGPEWRSYRVVLGEASRVKEEVA